MLQKNFPAKHSQVATAVVQAPSTHRSTEFGLQTGE